jgi:adenylate kinase family enzyme
VKRVAVFGNAGGGKSTLAKKLAEVTGLPLFPLDRIQWRVGGEKVPDDEYLQRHAQLLRQDACSRDSS